MLKLKYLEENFELARFALENWHHDEETLTSRMRWFRISSNAVYPFDCHGQLCFLRMAPAEEKDPAEWLGEMDFLHFLHCRQYPALRPIAAQNGEYLLSLHTPWGKWYAAAFEGVPGRPLDDLTLTDALANEYGAALGRLHAVSMQYDSPFRRRSERDVLEWIRLVFQANAMPERFFAVLQETEQALSDLPRSRTSYGIIHYDFEPDNVFWDGTQCHAIDFEDSMLHFYAADVVQALDELPEAHRASFLCGYRTACPAAEVWESTFVLMRRFRDLYSCARLLHCLSEKLDPEPGWMPQLTARLENRLNELKNALS